MTFYDMSPDDLPEGARYYHNVLMVLAGVSFDIWPFDEELKAIWYLDELNAQKPTVYLLYYLDQEEEDEEEEIDFEIEYVSHAVIEITTDGEIGWYYGDEEDGEFNAKNPWKYD